MAPHKRLRIRPRVRTAVGVRHHPSGRGRSHGYSTESRQLMLSTDDHINNGHYQGRHLVLHLRAIREWAHRTTVWRWRQRRATLGHIRRFRRTGNVRATVLKGRLLLSLALWRVFWPRGIHHEANVWLFHSNGQTRFYHPSQISRAEDDLALSTKRASVTARQALLAINRQLRYNYWYLPLPFGIANAPRERIIDIDEAALFTELANRSRGKAALIRRVRDVGPYGHSEKLNILTAICGEEPLPGQSARRWVDTWRDGGTTINKFQRFIQRVLDDLGPGTPNDHYVFTMDNLNTHRNILIQQMIYAAGHVCVFRAPYCPVDSPIEHLFNTIQIALTLAMYNINTIAEVRRWFLATLRRMRSFHRYFEHVGMRN